jgi:hypothetical protein
MARALESRHFLDLTLRVPGKSLPPRIANSDLHDSKLESKGIISPCYHAAKEIMCYTNLN